MRTNIMYIINVLRLFSSKEHPLTHTQITDYTNKCYDPAEQKLLSNSSTQRLLTHYITDSLHLNDMPLTKLHCNFKIHVLEKNPYANSYTDEYIDITDKIALEGGESRSSKSKTRYYYYEPFVSPEDLADMMNMIECHPYYNTTEVIQLTESLKSICPAYFNGTSHLPFMTSNRAISTSLRENLHKLHKFIALKEDIKIVYCHYDENKELVPNEGYQQPYRVTPYRIMWANGYCYLVAYNSHYQELSNYRVDRITEIHAITDGSAKDLIGKNQVLPDSIDYAKAHPVMIAGETLRVSLLCQKNSGIVNRLIDSFGMDVRIQPVSEKKLNTIFPGRDLDPDKWLDVTCVDVNDYGIALWAKQYCTEAIIYYPPELAQQTKRELQEAANMYP